MNKLGMCRNIAFAAVVGAYGLWQSGTVNAAYYECNPGLHGAEYYGEEIDCNYGSSYCDGFCGLCGFGGTVAVVSCEPGLYVLCACG